jgi:hypothetical protein
VQQGGGQEILVGRLPAGQVERLEGVVEGVPFGVPARVLADSVEGEEEIEEVVVHPEGGPEGEGGLYPKSTPTPTGSHGHEARRPGLLTSVVFYGVGAPPLGAVAQIARGWICGP